MWAEDLHGGVSELAQGELPLTEGRTEPVGKWTFHDAYCGIGGMGSGLALAGGVCTGAFESDRKAREVYQQRVHHQPDGAWGTFDPQKWSKARVLVSAPPCEDVPWLIGKNEDRQMWKHLRLIHQFRYEVVVIETLLHFKRMQNGMVYRALVQKLNEMGYAVRNRMLFAPAFGAVAARKRMYMYCTRVGSDANPTTLLYPTGDDQRHPVRSILEPEFFRRGVRVTAKELVTLPQPIQRTTDSLIKIGYVQGEGRNRDVYSADGLAATQQATGSGMGWTSGLYMVGNTPSRLTVREAARALQISDHVDLGEKEPAAMRYIGNTTAVGVARAIGRSIEKALLGTGLSKREGQKAGGEQTTTNRRHWRLTPEWQDLSRALHEAQMMAWAATDAARAVVNQLRFAILPCYAGVTDDAMTRARSGIEAFHRRRWLVLQQRRGAQEVDKLAAAGADADTVRRAGMTVRKALWLERMRAGEEESPINLLWWNWTGPVPQELLVGYKLPFRRPPPSVFPDNYDTADVEKVWKEFDRMTERGYMEQCERDELHMTHPMAAVPKKHSDKLRIIVDCTASMLNECLIAQRFVLPQVQDAARKCYKGCWMMTVDLQDGFYGVEVTGPDRMYLGLRHPRTGKYYRYTRLAMGMACAPHAFSRLVAWAVKVAGEYPEFKATRMVVNDTNPNMPRVYGVDAEARPVPTSDWFVDDGLLVAPTEESCRAAYRRLVWVLESRLGWRICRSKSVGPTRCLEFCGLTLDSLGTDVGGPCTRLSEERRTRCQKAVGDFTRKISRRRRANRREMAKIVGELSFAANAIPAGRCFLVRLYATIHEMESEVKGKSHDYDREVTVEVGAFLDLMWWATCLRESDCVVLWRSQTFALHRCWSDASNYGFAESVAVAETHDFPQMAFTHGVWPEAVAGFSSNWHELATITHSIVSRGPALRNSQIHYMTDNTTSVAAVNSGTVRSTQLMKLARELKRAQAKYNIGIEAIHLSGQLIQVQGTDGASRAMPFLGMYSGMEGSHDMFDPVEWPRFELSAELADRAAEALEVCTQDASDPRTWLNMDFAGEDTFLHLRPAHVAPALERLMEGQMREGKTTAFTVITPAVGLREWRKYLKHFRQRVLLPLEVPGLGTVKHWVLRFNAGDGLLPRGMADEEDMLESDGRNTEGLEGVDGLGEMGVEEERMGMDRAVEMEGSERADTQWREDCD